jgi:Uma2 family endonuclease
MTVERRVMTAEELLRLPEDGTRRELLDGELRTMSPTGAGHGEHESAITFHIGTYLSSHPVARLWGGEVGFVLRRSPDRVRAPDIAVMRRERVPPAGFFEGAPDMAIEVVSPGDTADEVEAKVQEWLAAGAETVWVVYPTGPRLAVHWPDGSARTYGPDDEVDGGPVLPGFRIRLSVLLTPPGF